MRSKRLMRMSMDLCVKRLILQGISWLVDVAMTVVRMLDHLFDVAMTVYGF